MTYPLGKQVHQPTLSAELSDALGRAVRVAQRPPADGDEPGALVVVDDATGEELDDLDGTTVADVLDAHAPPEPPDPVAEFRQQVEAAQSVADLKAALLGGDTSGPGAEPRRGRSE